MDDQKSPKSGGDQEEKRERPLSARRSIRLTVLPPLNGAAATKTSHNGLIEVENSDQTVEEAHREHFARMMKFGNSTDNEVPGICIWYFIQGVPSSPSSNCLGGGGGEPVRTSEN